MYLLIDNYDSFTYNVFHLLASHCSDEVKVIRNDAISIEEIAQMSPKGIIISPGPCTPKDAGICVPLIKELKASIPILGICLGMQAIGEAFGASIIRSPLPMHGKVDKITHHDNKILKDIPSPLYVTRYHSLCIDANTLPKDIIPSAHSDDDVIQAVYHQELPLYGLQFHPESVRTQYGDRMIQNYLNLVKDFHS
ncbi:MAG: anthranilate synthase component II [Alphaproteobacteria bacterium]